MADPGDYPLSMWEQQRARYWEYWRHFDGNWLNETISETDDTLRYPLNRTRSTWPVCFTRASCSGKSRTAPIRW